MKSLKMKYHHKSLALFSITAMLMGAVSLSHQPMSLRGPASASLDFNEMIEESQKNTAELNKEFQKNAGIEKKILNAGKISEENRAIPTSPEQFAAKSSSQLFNSPQENKFDDKADMKRLSRELQEIE